MESPSRALRRCSPKAYTETHYYSCGSSIASISGVSSSGTTGNTSGSSANIPLAIITCLKYSFPHSCEQATSCQRNVSPERAVERQPSYSFPQTLHLSFPAIISSRPQRLRRRWCRSTDFRHFRKNLQGTRSRTPGWSGCLPFRERTRR